jgi:hypothetical protein
MRPDAVRIVTRRVDRLQDLIASSQARMDSTRVRMQNAEHLLRIVRHRRSRPTRTVSGRDRLPPAGRP